eukprot:8510217-Pyramimonas_sp.AAC.1
MLPRSRFARRERDPFLTTVSVMADVLYLAPPTHSSSFVVRRWDGSSSTSSSDFARMKGRCRGGKKPPSSMKAAAREPA